MTRPAIIITAGDPEGIGPEITRKALSLQGIKKLADFQVIESDDKTGFDAIEKALRILKEGNAQALVTAPVNKSKISSRLIPFKGHTEYIASVTDTERFAMMFYSARIKVSLVTRHIPLKEVPGTITGRKIRDTITLTYEALRDHFGIESPRIGVCGLNPHSGEGGVIGTEEKEIIGPVVEDLSREIPGLAGPISADVAFYKAYNNRLDAVVSMYHDQALAPFKMIAFDTGVNVTLGLPFVRTSPDHGTAYDIAGKGIADPGSMKEAIKLAAGMCRNVKRKRD